MRDDAEFNIQFCEVMEKYPELYDYTRTDYSNRIVVDQAWKLIANEVNESEAECKERWKNIRGRYTKNRNSKKVVKDYYLAPYLQFLNNFIKCRQPKGNNVQNIQIPIAEIAENDESNPLSFVKMELPDQSLSDYQNSPMLNEAHQSSDYLTAEKQTLKRKLVKEDSDLCFLKSLLPDMKEMSPRKKRKFKIMILNTASKLLDENEARASASGMSSTYRESSPVDGVDQEQNYIMYNNKNEIEIELED